MINLYDFEREFLENDHEVFEGFDIAHIVSNTKNSIDRYKAIKDMNWAFDYYSDILEKAITDFENIKLNKVAVSEFISNYKNSEKVPISIDKIRNTSDIVIKPQFLSQYVETVFADVKDIVDNKKTSISHDLGSRNITKKVKRQVVKLPDEVVLFNAKDLITNRSNKIKVICDDIYIDTAILPFVQNFENTKKLIDVEAHATLNAIKEAANTVRNIMSYCQEQKDSGNVSPDVLVNLNLSSYHLARNIVDIISYISFIETRKLLEFNNNVITCNKLNDSIIVMTNVKEGYEDDIVIANDLNSITEQLVSGSSDGFYELSNNIYNFNKGDFVDDDLLDGPDAEEINTYKEIYENISKDYIIISRGLDIISTSTIESPEGMIMFDDVINKSGFSIVLTERFRGNLKLIDDVSNYESAVNNAVSFDAKLFSIMLREVKEYHDNMLVVAKNIHMAYEKLIMLLKRYEHGFSNEVGDLEVINRLSIFLKDLRNQFVDLTNIVGEKFLNRLKLLGKLLVVMNTQNKDNDMDSDELGDFTEGIIDDMLKAFEECSEENLKNILNDVYTEYFKESFGLNLIMEADEEQNASNTNQKVTVTDNSDQNSQNNTAVKTTAGITSETGKNIVERFIQWITDTLNKFTSNPKIDKNTNWLASNKQALIDRSYNNVQVNILPYSSTNIQNISSDINKIANGINALTPQMIQDVKTKDEMLQKLFTNIPGGVNSENMKEKFSNYYKTATGDKAQAINIANAELKSNITNEIIPFCENYKQYQNNIKAECDTLNRTVQNLLKKTSTVSESVDDVITEADEPAKNTTTSMSSKCTWITSSVQTMIGCILNGMSCKYNDYFKVLSSLAPKAPAAGKDVDNQIREQQTENQAGNQAPPES